jgi:hypothetical protein
MQTDHFKVERIEVINHEDDHQAKWIMQTGALRE